MVLLIAVIVLLIFAIITYNRLVSLRNYVKEAFSTMDVYLKKRWDLVPNLAAIVQAYTKHEKGVFSEIAAMRARSYSDFSDSEKLDANKKIGKCLAGIIAVAENYPELKADEHYSKMMEELYSIEEDIANSRKYYNGCVRMLNNNIEIFPFNIVAGIFGFKSAKMFEISDEERQNIKVEF
ncbi:MAG: LemA family protein [Cyanobacteriota bacterium]|nr:LemA family protein [Cyanobacteriota bacterium]MDY6358580.1 LemA family protein [Cyanobacteriota bacterium]MDY6364617.1 LemA family protein [Cyanobacteriota bacterium]MDY6383049.1 LemA family protein [Cyanobacteriota bacterium]